MAGELDELVDGLLARKTRDVILHEGTSLLFTFPALQKYNLYHHGHHHVHPTGANQRQGAVKIKENHPRLSRRYAGMKTFDHAIHLLLCNTNYDPMQTAASVKKMIENKGRGVAVVTSEWTAHWRET